MNKNKLIELYINQRKDIYEIARIYKIEHKLLRAFLHKYNIRQNTFIATNHKKSYLEPNFNQLLKPISISAHTNYLCEGWHTQETNHLIFYNQDESLIDIFSKCLTNIYLYDKQININITYNKNSPTCQKKFEYYHEYFLSNKNYSITESNDSKRKNPIIRARCGGKNLAKLFIENAYEILNEINS